MSYDLNFNNELPLNSDIFNKNVDEPSVDLPSESLANLPQIVKSTHYLSIGLGIGFGISTLLAICFGYLYFSTKSTLDSTKSTLDNLGNDLVEMFLKLDKGFRLTDQLKTSQVYLGKNQKWAQYYPGTDQLFVTIMTDDGNNRYIQKL